MITIPWPRTTQVERRAQNRGGCRPRRYAGRPAAWLTSACIVSASGERGLVTLDPHVWFRPADGSGRRPGSLSGQKTGAQTEIVSSTATRSADRQPERVARVERFLREESANSSSAAADECRRCSCRCGISDRSAGASVEAKQAGARQLHDRAPLLDSPRAAVDARLARDPDAPARSSSTATTARPTTMCSTHQPGNVRDPGCDGVDVEDESSGVTPEHLAAATRGATALVVHEAAASRTAPPTSPRRRSCRRRARERSPHPIEPPNLPAPFAWRPASTIRPRRRLGVDSPGGQSRLPGLHVCARRPAGRARPADPGFDGHQQTSSRCRPRFVPAHGIRHFSGTPWIRAWSR